MPRSLAPRDNRFFDYFIHQAELACQASETLARLLENYHDAARIMEEIHDIEHQGDETRRDVMTLLNTSFVTPIDREDIQDLSSSLDDVLDFIHGTASRLVLYKVTQVPDPARALGVVLRNSTQVVLALVKTLPHFKSDVELRARMRKLEREGDEVNRAAIAGLFEGGIPVIDVIKWKEIYEQMEEAIDRCDDVADEVDSVMLKHA